MKSAKFSASLMLLAFLAPLAQVTGAYEENAEAVRDLGTSKGEPINTGYVFINNLYIAPPYVVERCGLAILVNGLCVCPGCEYPTRNLEVVNDDPGDLPPGITPSSPNPPSQPNYWIRKRRYLIARFGKEKGKVMLMDLYRKCGAYKRIYEDPDSGNPVCVDYKGREREIMLDATRTSPRTKVELISEAEQSKHLYESSLKESTLILWKEGFEVGRPGEAGLRLLEALLLDDEVEAKVALIKREHLYTLEDSDIRSLVQGFKATVELRRRVEAERAGTTRKATTEESPLLPPDLRSPGVRKELPQDNEREGETHPEVTSHNAVSGRMGTRWLAVGFGGAGLLLLVCGLLRWVRTHKKRTP